MVTLLSAEAEKQIKDFLFNSLDEKQKENLNTYFGNGGPATDSDVLRAKISLVASLGSKGY